MPGPFEVKTGTYTGTGAAQTVTLGFKPHFIYAVNQTDNDLIWFHINGQTAATAHTVVLATAAVSSQGCTPVATGFTLGTDATINETGKTYVYFAIGTA